MSNYEIMLQNARENYTARVTKMVRGGMTTDEAKASIKAATERSFNAASARAKCGITNRPSTIGEILAAKAR